jgi:hypothetical protein
MLVAVASGWISVNVTPALDSVTEAGMEVEPPITNTAVSVAWTPAGTVKDAVVLL